MFSVQRARELVQAPPEGSAAEQAAGVAAAAEQREAAAAAEQSIFVSAPFGREYTAGGVCDEVLMGAAGPECGSPDAIPR